MYIIKGPMTYYVTPWLRRKSDLALRKFQNKYKESFTQEEGLTCLGFLYVIYQLFEVTC